MPRFQRLASDAGELHAGWLVIHKPRLLRPPKRRYFRLTAETLSYYKHKDDVIARGHVALSGVERISVLHNPALPAGDANKRRVCLHMAGSSTKDWFLHAATQGAEAVVDALDGWLVAFRTVGLCAEEGLTTPTGSVAESKSAAVTFNVHLPDMCGMVVFRVKPSRVTITELKEATMVAVERFLAAHDATQRMASAAPPDLAGALRAAAATTKRHAAPSGGSDRGDAACVDSVGSSSAPDSSDGAGAGADSSAPIADDAGAGPVDSASAPAPAAAPVPPSGYAQGRPPAVDVAPTGPHSGASSVSTGTGFGFMDGPASEGAEDHTPSPKPRPHRTSVVGAGVGALVALPPRVEPVEYNSDDDDSSVDSDPSNSLPLDARRPAAVTVAPGVGAGGGAGAGADSGDDSGGSEPEFVDLRSLLRGHPSPTARAKAGAVQSPRSLARSDSPRSDVMLVPKGRHAVQLFLNTPPGPEGLLASSVEDSDASDYDQFDFSATQSPTRLGSTFSDSDFAGVSVATMSAADARRSVGTRASARSVVGPPVPPRRVGVSDSTVRHPPPVPARGSTTGPPAAANGSSGTSGGEASGAAPEPGAARVPVVSFKWPSALPSPACVKARRDAKHSTLTVMRTVVGSPSDRYVLKASGGDFALENEGVTFDRYAFHEGASGDVDLRLVSKGAAPLLQAFIPTTASARDVITNKQFVQYCITVRFDKTEWVIRRRFADFKRLHEQLSKTVPPKTLPRLPKRGLFTTNTRAPKFVDKRRHKLERYLQDVLCHPQCENSVELLSWLGGVSTMRNDAEESKHRGVIHLSKVLDFVHTGDIVLFRCRNMLSGLQRRVTRSEFDHVGVVVSHRGRMHLLEATGDGVTCNPLKSRLKSYGNEYTEGIAIRRLTTERTLDMEAGLRRFVSSVEGKPYKLTPAKLFSRGKGKKDNGQSGQPSGASFQAGDSGDDSDGDEAMLPTGRQYGGVGDVGSDHTDFFCSELVAAAYQALAVLPPRRVAASYWPSDFASGGRVDKELINATLEDEIVLDCKVMEVRRATRMVDFHRRQISTGSRERTWSGSS